MEIIQKKRNISPLTKCDSKKFLESGNIEELKDCYYIFPDIKPIEYSNPLDRRSGKKSYLINSKKTDYYIYEYNPEKIIMNIKNFDISDDIKEDYISKLSEIADLTPKQNCCNCISFILYINYDQKIIDNWDNEIPDEDIYSSLYKLYNFLYSLQLSIINIDKCLPNFISRIYLDISVFKLLFETKKIIDKYVLKTNKMETIFNKCINILELLFLNKSTEIYTIISDGVNNIHNTRSYRFLTMIEPDVNIKVFRDADGYVSYLDCMNISKFSNNNTLMLVYNLTEVDNFISKGNLDILDELKNKFTTTYISTDRYSKWLKHEQEINEYCKNNNPLFDLLAGLFSLSVQIKSEKYLFFLDELIEHKDVTLDERLLFRLFIKLISIKDPENESRDFFIDTPDKLNNIFFILHNFTYPNLELIIENIRNPKPPYSYYRTVNIIQTVNNFLVSLKTQSLLSEDYLKQIKSYYSSFFEKIKVTKYSSESWLITMVLIDLIFQENIINNTNKIFSLKVDKNYSNSTQYYYSVHLQNEFMFDYEDLVNYVYIDRPLNIMSDKVLAMYRGGYYHKYLKYNTKYQNI
jgi:hypothetical protein